MVSRQDVVSLVLDCVKDLNRTRAPDKQVRLSEDTVLLGREGALESLALVSLIVDVEQRASDAFGKAVTLADERAMSLRQSPFRTIGSVCDYLLQRLNEKGPAAHG